MGNLTGWVGRECGSWSLGPEFKHYVGCRDKVNLKKKKQTKSIYYEGKEGKGDWSSSVTFKNFCFWVGPR